MFKNKEIKTKKKEGHSFDKGWCPHAPSRQGGQKGTPNIPPCGPVGAPGTVPALGTSRGPLRGRPGRGGRWTPLGLPVLGRRWRPVRPPRLHLAECAPPGRRVQQAALQHRQRGRTCVGQGQRAGHTRLCGRAKQRPQFEGPPGAVLRDEPARNA